MDIAQKLVLSILNSCPTRTTMSISVFSIPSILFPAKEIVKLELFMKCNTLK